MDKVQLGLTDCTVSRLCYGQAFIGLGKCTEAVACRLLDIFLDHGGNFIDTARVYSDWIPPEKHLSERIIGNYLQRTGKRKDFILCSKCCHFDLKTMAPRVSAKCFMEDLEGSLTDLQTDCIDLYLFHRDDVNTDVGELIEAAQLAVRQGKIRYYGCSNWSVPRMEAADAIAEADGHDGFQVDQITLNPTVGLLPPPGDPSLLIWGKDLADYHRQTRKTVMACSSLANGLFSMYGTDAFAEKHGQLLENKPFVKMAKHLSALSEQTGLTPAQLCLRYVADYPQIHGIPVFTASSEAHLLECLACFDSPLPPNAFPWL